jgi:hypothetical protein
VAIRATAVVPVRKSRIGYLGPGVRPR